MRASGVTDASGIDSIQFDVYNTELGTDRHVGYYAADRGGGTYEASFNLLNFNNLFGTYVINVWGTDKYGNRGLMGSRKVTVQ